MLRTLIHNPRRRGLVGALVFASVPLAVGTWFNGMTFAFERGYDLVDLGLMSFLGFVGYGVFHGGGSRFIGDDVDSKDWSDHDRDRQDFMAQTGIYTSMREQWDPNYMRDKY